MTPIKAIRGISTSLTAITVAVMTSLLLISCRSGDRTPQDSKALLSIGDTVLYESMITSRIPAGLAETDSVRLFNKLVDEWITGVLLLQVAEEYPISHAEIEKKLADYHRHLIIADYRRLMAQEPNGNVPEDSVRKRFLRDYAGRKLAEPLVKGILMKVAKGSSRMNAIRRWLDNPTVSSVDNVEKYGIQEALAYDNFMSRWVEWSQIARQLPPDADAASLKPGTTLELPVSEAVCLLYVAEIAQTGDSVPFEFAAPQIREEIIYELDAASEDRIIKELYAKGVRDGKVRVIGYDPLTKERLDKKIE